MKPRNIIITLVVLALMIGSRFVLPVKQVPEVSVAAEVLFRPGGYPFTNSILMTLLVDVILVGLAIAGTASMKLIPGGLQNFWEMAVDTFYGLGVSIDPRNIARMFTLVATIFFFFLFSNLLALVPGVGSIGVCRTREAALINPLPAGEQAPAPSAEEQATEVQRGIEASGGACGAYRNEQTGGQEAEVLVPLFRAPSADLNTTLAVAVISFLFIEYYGFKTLGLGYLGKFFNFKEGPIMTFVGFIELISEFVRIPAFAFRLFGNIFAGEVMLGVMAFLIPLLLPFPFYGLELFVAVIQAFIFAALTMAFVNQATTGHAEHDSQGEHVEASPADIAH